MLELKNALEEDLTARLGLDRQPPHDELIARARAAGVLDPVQAVEVERLLTLLSQVEASLVSRHRTAADRVRDADVLRVAGRVRALLDEVGARPVIHSKEPS
jgi:hypothetical protein